jgi:hypothetical protein
MKVMKTFIIIFGVIFTSFICVGSDANTDAMTVVRYPKTISCRGEYSVNVAYDTKEERMLMLALFTDKWKYLICDKKLVKGKGECKLSLSYPAGTPGEKYWSKVILSKKEDIWKKIIKKYYKRLSMAKSFIDNKSEDIALAAGEAEVFEVVEFPSVISPGEEYTVKVNYHVKEQRILFMVLFDEKWKYLDEVSVFVEAKGSCILGLKSAKIKAGQKYWARIMLSGKTDKWKKIIRKAKKELLAK